MTYTADVSMFPYFKNSTRDQIYSEGYEEGCEEKAQELAEFKNKLKECMTKHKQEIEEIEEEKEELEIQNTCLLSDSYNEISMAQYEDMQEDYEEEIQKLKRENDILNAYREEQTKIEKIIGDDDLIGRKVEDIVDIAPYIEKLKRENEGLKEKIEEQEYEIEEQREIIDDLDEYKDKYEDMEEELCNQSLKYKEEIAKLKEENDDDDIELWRKDYLAWCKDWMDRNIDGSAMPSESLFNQLQLSMEEDLVNHYNENIKDDDTMNADIKKLWLEIFYDVEEGEDVKNLESVGELYDDIQEYFDKQ